MASYGKLVITSNGQALIAKMLAGTNNVQFTKICASSTKYTESQLEALTSLSNIKQTTLVSKVTRTNNTAVRVDGAFSNADLTTGYYMYTLGLYAVDPSAGEILFAACVETSGSCYMPPYNGVTKSAAYIQMYTTVGNASDVSMTVDSGAYATIGDIDELENEIADMKAYVGYTDGDIYGVEVDFKNKKFTRLAAAENMTPGESFDAVEPWGGRKRCNLTNTGKIIAYYGDAGFTTTGKLTTAVDLNASDATTKDTSLQFAAGTIVQTMVEQPKFYYKVVPLQLEKKGPGFITRKVRYYVSPTPKAGFKLHPAFKCNGEELDHVYMSAFEGSLYDVSASAYILDDAQVADFSADMLSSIANAIPASGLTQNLTRANDRKLAENRGTGWEQDLIQTRSATELLMLIEYASFNMQSCIGMGAVSKTDDGSTNMAEATGATVTLGNASGAVTNSNGIQIVSYRGEENDWGNIWKWNDGQNVSNSASFAAGMYGRVYIADHGFADNIGTDPYEATNLYMPCGEGYINAFAYDADFDWVFYPGEYGGNTSVPVGDYGWNYSAGWRVVMSGSVWGNGLEAGAFSWNAGSDSGGRYRYVGGRLVYRPITAAV